MVSKPHIYPFLKLVQRSDFGRALQSCEKSEKNYEMLPQKTKVRQMHSLLLSAYLAKQSLV